MRMLLQQVINDEPPSLRKLKSTVPRDLETICLKCLEKAPDKRYSTAEEFGNDLERFLNGQTIMARPAGRLEKSLKWCRKRPTITSLVAILICVICVFLGSTTWLWRRAEDAKHDQYLKLYASDMNLANQAWSGNNINLFETLLGRHSTSGQRGFEWHYLWRLGSQNRSTLPIEMDGRIRGMSLSQTHNLLSVACGNGLITFFDLSTRRKLPNLRVNLPPLTTTLTSDQQLLGWARICVALSNVRELAAYPSGDRQSVELHDIRTGSKSTIPGSNSQIRAIAFSPSDSRLAVGDALGSVQIRNLKSEVPVEESSIDLGAEMRRHSSSPGIRHIEFDTTEQQFAVVGDSRDVFIVDVKSGDLVESLSGHAQATWSVKYSLDGKYLATCCADGRVILWERGRDGKTTLLRSWEFDDEVRDICFSPDGDLLAVGCRDNTASVRVPLLENRVLGWRHLQKSLNKPSRNNFRAHRRVFRRSTSRTTEIDFRTPARSRSWASIAQRRVESVRVRTDCT